MRDVRHGSVKYGGFLRMFGEPLEAVDSERAAHSGFASQDGMLNLLEALPRALIRPETCEVAQRPWTFAAQLNPHGAEGKLSRRRVLEDAVGTAHAACVGARGRACRRVAPSLRRFSFRLQSDRQCRTRLRGRPAVP